MDESPVPNSSYALQLALQTMKERCVQLQKRIATLQEENLALKTSTPRLNDNSYNSLESKVSKLTEERNQLKNTITMVAAENKQLWSSLSRLTNEHRSNNIPNTNTLNINEKAHMPLIRSRTFTQDAPHTKHLQKVLSESEKTSLELEDISLKLQNSITITHVNNKHDCEDINEDEMDLSLENSLHSLGFNYLEDDEVDESLSDSIEQHLMDLKNIKLILTQHNETLKSTVNNVRKHKLDLENKKEQSERKHLEKYATKFIQVNIDDEEKQKLEIEKTQREEEVNQVSPQQDWGTPDSSLKFDKNMDKICPMCSKKFLFDVDFDVFTKHVEEHFMENMLHS